MSEHNYKVGDPVMVDSIEGFGGTAVVTGVRDSPHNKYQVFMDDRSQPAFWAHDAELSPAPPSAGKIDSRLATCEHIREVRGRLDRFIEGLTERRAAHDRSKLESPEREAFDEFTPKLAATTYGSDEYKRYLAAMQPALDHHYAANSHHPEHFPDGIKGMNLLDIVEMLCDWGAACKRHRDGDIRRSIEVNQKRFGYTDELKAILLNTLAIIE